MNQPDPEKAILKVLGFCVKAMKLNQEELREEELGGLLESIYDRYGFDFRKYARAHIRRRLMNRLKLEQFPTFSAMQVRILTDETFMGQILSDLSITVTEMFRDPSFYASFRQHIIPILKTYPFIKIWHAGCATGEEVYSMAILLQEEGLYDRTTFYATDFNQRALDQAREAIFPNNRIKEYSANYQLAGGKLSLSEYYTSHYDHAILNQSLRKNIVWANHNLVTDSVFAEVNVILCRNVLIYFNRSLQNHVQKLFYESLMHGGFLCLGSKESLRFTDFEKLYAEVDAKQRIFKRKY